MALFDNIINKYFKTPDPGEPPVDDLNVPPTEDKAGATADDLNVAATKDKAETSAGASSGTASGTTSGTTGEAASGTTATEESGSSGPGVYEQLWERLFGGSEGQPESEEEIEEREKRERRNATISALGDAISGIANIWGATKGATPMDLSSLSEANKMRYDYAKERRERNQEAWRRGMYNARANDMKALALAEEARRKAEEKAAAQKYKEEQDRIKHEQWKTKYDFDVEQAKQKAELDRLKFEETQKKNEADRRIRERTIALAEKKANDALNNKSEKVTRFGLSDGTNITVPDDLKGSYVADVYNKLVDAAGDATIDSNGNTKNPILSFMKFQYGQKEPGLNEMMTAIQLYKDEYPGIEDYMINRAKEYTENYNTPVVAKDSPAPGSPGEPTVPLSENKEAAKVGAMAGAIEKHTPLTEDDLLEYLIE